MIAFNRHQDRRRHPDNQLHTVRPLDEVEVFTALPGYKLQQGMSEPRQKASGYSPAMVSGDIPSKL